MAEKKVVEKKGIEKAGEDWNWTEEVFEESNSVYVKTDYPEPGKKFRIVLEAVNLNAEESYFWILNQLKYDLSFPNIEKVTDIFSSSEGSSFWGQASQRLGIQQDRIQATLVAMAKMVQDLFRIVREMRIMDERIATYSAWNDKHSKAADATLKEIFINLVESGGQQMRPSSVYGLAQNVGYSTLPDWFFNTRIFKKDELDDVVDKLPTNNNVRNVLRRKLFEFLTWKEQTQKELEHRRKFQLHFLRQHWAIMKMYMAWLKPYLRNVKRLSMNENQILGPEVISAFETAAIEIELLANNPAKDDQTASQCMLLTFKYFVKPSLTYQQPESYQRGPTYIGKIEISMRSYGWSKQEIEAYKKYRHDEEMELLGVLDDSLKSAMDVLGDDLNKYLAEAGEEEFKKLREEQEKKKDPRNALQKWLNVRVVDKQEAENTNILEPFLAIFQGFGEIIGSFVPSQTVKGKKVDNKASKKKADEVSKTMFILLKNYKKSHQMLTW